MKKDEVHIINPPVPKTDPEGQLGKFIKQPVDNTPSENENGLTYTEKWKGPYSEGAGILSEVGYNDTIDDVRRFFGLSGYLELYQPPTCPDRNGRSGTWRINDIRVDEYQEGGAHCIITIVYYADYLTFAGWENDPKSDIWNIEWQGYTVSPYNFLANVDHTDAYVFDPEDPPEVDWETQGMRSHIQSYVNATDQLRGKNYCYHAKTVIVPNQCMQVLNGAEQEVYKKIAIDRNAVYHYPVITHTTAKTGPLSCLSGEQKYPDTLGIDLDTILSAMPEGCPYILGKYPNSSAGKDWSWLKVGDSIQTTKSSDNSKVRVERKEQWIGSTAFDKNFYGEAKNFQHTEEFIKNERWELEAL